MAEEKQIQPDTQWPTYEVFSQRKRGEPHRHVGAVHAPDPEMALMLARDQFARRERVVQLWIVPSDHVYATAYEDSDMLFGPMDKDYRNAANFPVTAMIRAWEASQEEDSV